MPYTHTIQRLGVASPVPVCMAVAGCLLLWGCGTAPIPGPKLHRVPKDLHLVIVPERTDPLLADRTMIDQRAYVSGSPEGARIRLTTYAGTANRNEALEAWLRDAGEGAGVIAGPLDELAPGDSSAWGWRRLHYEEDALAFREFVAVRNDSRRNRVYTVEYRVPAASPVREAAMKETALGVGVDRTDVSLAKLGLAAGLLAVLALAVALGRRPAG